MTIDRKVEIVSRHIRGESPEQLAKAFELTPEYIRDMLRHVYNGRVRGRKLKPERCEYPVLAGWICDNGLCGAWLAEKMGISKQQVNNYLHGRVNIPPSRRNQIAEITGMSEAELFEHRKGA